VTGKDGAIVQSVMKSSRILELFVKNTELGISEISDEMGMSKSTAYGLVNTLVEAGMLEQNDENKKYRLGLKLFELGSLVEKRMDIRQEARPYCVELVKKYGQTVHLATHSQGEVLYIDKFDDPDFLIVYSQVGKKAPMSVTGVGKAMLSYLGEEYAEEFVVNNLVSRTANSITTKENLFEKMQEIRSRGYAVDDEEIQMGLRCVAAPIFSKGGKVTAAISISGMANIITKERIEEIAKDVMECASNISKRLGYIK